MEIKDRIPVTILSGFLGSGKTTLLNQLIKSNPQKKLAVIENEFGETGIDGDLVIGVDDNIFELSNGCICCSLNNDLKDVLDKLLKSKHNIDHLLVETTGIADPGAVASAFLGDEEVQKKFRLDAIITVVDARFIEQQLENVTEAKKQVMLADLILINKEDLADKYICDTAENIIKRLNPQATTQRCSNGIVEKLDLLNLNAFDPKNIAGAAFNVNTVQLNFSRPGQKRSSINPGGSFISNTPKQDLIHSFSSLSFVFKEPLNARRFDAWITLMLNFKKDYLYRTKGILNFRNISKKIIFQSVYNQYTITEGDAWENHERQSKLIFIGRNIRKEDLEEGLFQCVASEEEELTDDFFDVMADLLQRK